LGAYYLLAPSNGRGLLLGGASGVQRGKVTIIGGGVAGRAACELAVGQGAKVVVFEKSPLAIEAIERQFGNKVQVLYSSPALIDQELEDTDLLIGAVLIPGARAPRVISRKQIQMMPKGSVFIDISIDQGGCGETIRATTHANPTYVEEDVIHYGVCNIPALSPRTSAQALSNAIVPFVLEVGSGKWSENLKNAICTEKGMIPHPEVRYSIEQYHD
jgi:alanine dehydrogenase